MKNISLLGSTGSIGTQALDVIKNLGMKVVALTANQNIKLLEKQAREFNPELVCIFDENYYIELKENLKDTSICVTAGLEGCCKAAALDSADIVLNSVVGMVGLMPTMCAIENGKDVAIANKETLVAGGKLVMESAKKYGSHIIPVDSEHSAIFQCMQGNKTNQVSKIILTASGGPFLGKSRDFLKNVTVKDALNHPNWSMGRKISIDSATMMNKGLELIEAVWLFDKHPSEIEIVVHPQSILHSAVEYVDRSVIGQFGNPDMRIPIQYALTYPNRITSKVKPLSFFECQNLTFIKPDYDTFGCLNLCKEAISKGGLYPTVLNAANEKAVELFLGGKIGFLDIEQVVKKAMTLQEIGELDSMSSIFEIDKKTKDFVMNYFF